MVDGKLVDINDNLSVVGFDGEAFKTPGEILVTYHVLDRFGKETFRSITISVIDGEAEALPDAEGEVRFISEKYYLMGQDEGAFTRIPDGIHSRITWTGLRKHFPIQRVKEANGKFCRENGVFQMIKL